MAGAALILALILAPVIGGGFGELTNSILQILIFGGVAAYSLFPRRETGGWARVPGLIALAVYLVFFCLSVAFTEAIFPSLKQLLFVLACVCGYLLSASVCRDRRWAAAAVWAVVVTSLAISVYDIRGYAISTGGGGAFWRQLLYASEHLRASGTFINPDFFSGYLVIALPLSLAAYLVTRRALLAVVAGIAFVVNALALMLTGTKFGIIAAVAALLVFFLVAVATKALRRSRFTRLLVIAVVALPLMAVFSRPITSRIAAAEAGGSQVHSTEFRYYTWGSTWRMIVDRPWLGVGPGVYSIAYPRYTVAGPTKHAHQSYLQIAAESGVPALAALLVALLTIAYRSLAVLLSARRESSTPAPVEEPRVSDGLSVRDLVPFSGWRLLNCGIFAALVGSAVRNLADSDWYVIGIALPFWLLAGVLVAQSGAVRSAFEIGRRGRIVTVMVCAVLIACSVSFGAADLIAPEDLQGRGLSGRQLALRYRCASAISPLNPIYHRELARCVGDYPEAVRHLEIATWLAPTDAENYFLRGVLALVVADEPATAIRYFRSAHRLNPNSTRTLLWLAQAYGAAGEVRAQESTLRRLLAIERSPFERVRGVPEMVDTTYAYARHYFGVKLLKAQDYGAAKQEFAGAIERLERWRANPAILEAQRLVGRLSSGEERETLELLRQSYLGLAEACDGLGDDAGANQARRKARQVERDIEKLR